MQGRNLYNENESGGNASYIQGVPIQNFPFPQEDEILVYNSALNMWEYSTGGPASGVTSITNVGTGAEIFKGPIASNNANLRTLKNTDEKITIIQNTNEIDINLNTATINNIYNTDGTLTGARDVSLGENNLDFTNGTVSITRKNNIGPSILTVATEDLTAGAIVRLANTLTSDSFYLYYDPVSNQLALNQNSGCVDKDFIMNLGNGKLDLTSNIRIAQKLFDGTNSAGTSGQYLRSAGTQTQWFDLLRDDVVAGNSVWSSSRTNDEIRDIAFNTAISNFNWSIADIHNTFEFANINNPENAFHGFNLDLYVLSYNEGHVQARYIITCGEDATLNNWRILKPNSISEPSVVSNIQIEIRVGPHDLTLRARRLNSTGGNPSGYYMRILNRGLNGNITTTTTSSSTTAPTLIFGSNVMNVELKNLIGVDLTAPVAGNVLEFDGNNWINGSYPPSDNTIYTTDDSLLIASGGTRTITFPLPSGLTTSKLNFSGGSIQNNFSGMTTPNGTYSTVCNTMVAADSNGVMQGYSLPHTYNSAYFEVLTQNLLIRDDCLDFYQFNGTLNTVFSADFYLNSLGPSNTNFSYHWSVFARFEVNPNWTYICPVGFNSAFVNNDYVLEYRNTAADPLILQFRLRLIQINTVPSFSSWMRICCHDIDNSVQGKYTLLAQTKYIDSTPTLIYPFPPHNLYSYHGRNSSLGPPSITLDVQGQKFIKVSFYFTCFAKDRGILRVRILVNGNDTFIVHETLAQKDAMATISATSTFYGYTVIPRTNGTLFGWFSNVMSWDFSGTTCDPQFTLTGYPTGFYYSITVEESY